MTANSFFNRSYFSIDDDGASSPVSLLLCRACTLLFGFRGHLSGFFLVTSPIVYQSTETFKSSIFLQSHARTTGLETEGFSYHSIVLS